jgi:hypothetical protein
MFPETRNTRFGAYPAHEIEKLVGSTVMVAYVMYVREHGHDLVAPLKCNLCIYHTVRYHLRNNVIVLTLYNA